MIYTNLYNSYFRSGVIFAYNICTHILVHDSYLLCNMYIKRGKKIAITIIEFILIFLGLLYICNCFNYASTVNCAINNSHI